MRTEVCLVFSLLVILVACQPNSNTTTKTDSPSVIDTLALTQLHCSRCHAWPSPDLLDHATWEQYVLPRMSYFLGRYDEENSRATLIEPAALAVQQQFIFPEQSLLAEEEWKAIEQYYLKRAPAALSVETPAAAEEQDSFRPEFTDIFMSPPGTLAAGFLNDSFYVVSDVHKQQLMILNNSHELIGGWPVNAPVVELQTFEQGWLGLEMGPFSPTDRALGQLRYYSRENTAGQVLIDSLQRPVDFEPVDIDNDDKVDFLIAEYGKWTGRLAWWKQKENGQYEAFDLRKISGCISSTYVDTDGDGQAEVIALFGQGDEGIWRFRYAHGDFTSEQILSFPASYGSSSMTIKDWNSDGFPDIIYCAGDNADYPPILKPYHGIRVFLNDGKGKFAEQLFLPLPGAYGAEVADFDLDGDWDIVAISFFPDFGKTPQQSIVYFEQQGDGSFSRKYFAQEGLGRWLRIASGDPDNDGDTDILLGSMAFEVVPDRGEVAQWTKNGLGWLFLQNLTR